MCTRTRCFPIIVYNFHVFIYVFKRKVILKRTLLLPSSIMAKFCRAPPYYCVQPGRGSGEVLWGHRKAWLSLVHLGTQHSQPELSWAWTLLSQEVLKLQIERVPSSTVLQVLISTISQAPSCPFVLCLTPGSVVWTFSVKIINSMKLSQVSRRPQSLHWWSWSQVYTITPLVVWVTSVPTYCTPSLLLLPS